jgi:hypothetical protein
MLTPMYEDVQHVRPIGKAVYLDPVTEEERECLITHRWPEGRTIRYNLVQYKGSGKQRELVWVGRGKDGALVEVIE